MANSCPSCGAEIPENFRYCGFCGELIDSYRKGYPSEIEQLKDRSSRRFVAVLFADLVNFTSAAEGVDPEIIYRTIRNTLENLARIIQNFGGCVDRYYGDGFLATFGVPEAHEDDHFRALKSAIEMQASMRELGEKARISLNWDMQLRIGITIGPVIRGQLDTGYLQDSSIFGHTVNLASRLQAAARPETILVDESVYLKTSTKFRFNNPVELRLKGIEKPIFAYELLEQIDDHKPNSGRTGQTDHFVGRSFEKELLVQRLENLLTTRQGTITLITGEAGIGKSRLVEEVLPFHSKSVTIVRSQGSPFTSSNYAFVFDILSELDASSFNMNVSDQQNIRDLRISSGDHISTDPQEYLLRIIALTRSLVSQIANRQPLIIFFDDVQWADSSSLDVISHIIDLTSELPLSLVFVSRSTNIINLPDYLTETHYHDSFHFHKIELKSLSLFDSHRLIEKLVPDLLVPSTIRDEIFERSGGNPLFLEELVNALRDEFSLHQNEKDWEPENDWQKLIKDIPSTVNGLLLNRYDRQPQKMKIILDMASVIGHRFDVSLLALLCDIPNDEIRVSIDRLDRADILRRSMSVSSSIYSFRHALMQEAIYSTILYEDRILLHEKVAEKLKNVADEYYINADAIVGNHLELCGSFEAIDYLIKAAIRSKNHYANNEAIAYFSRAQKLLEKYGQNQPHAIDIALGLSEVLNQIGEADLAKNQLHHVLEQINSSVLPNYRIGDVYYQLGLNLYDLGEIDASRRNFENALVVLEKHQKECRLFSKTDIEREIGWIYWQKGEIDDSITHAKKALSLAQENSNTIAEGSARKLLASTYYWNGQIQQAIENAKKSLKIRESVGDIWKSGSTQTTLGHLYHQIGQWQLAERLLRQAIYVQSEIGDYYLLASSWSNLGLIMLDKGNIDEALDCMNESVEIVVKQNLPISLATPFFINRGIAYLRSGIHNRAQEDFLKGLNAAEEQSNNDLQALGLGYLSELSTDLGEESKAQVYLERANVLVEHSKSQEVLREIFRIEAFLQSAIGNYCLALNSISQAQDYAKKEGNQYEYAKLAIEKARILLANDNVDVIIEQNLHTEIENSLKLFKDLGAKPGISWAEGILFEIESHKTSHKEYSTELREYPTVVIDIQFKSPSQRSLHEETNEKAVRLHHILAKELKNIARKPNTFLNTSPNGFNIVIPTLDHKVLKDKQSVEAVEYALSALSVIMRVHKIGRQKFGYDITPAIGISIGVTHELVSNQEQAAIFSSVSQLGRIAQDLAKSAPDFRIVLTGELSGAIRESYQVEEFNGFSDLKSDLPCYSLGEAISQKSSSKFIPKSTDRLIGRVEEFSILRKHIEQVKRDSIGEIIYIEAEAGVGKSRMLREIRNTVGSELLFLYGKCEASSKSISYGPLIQILSQENEIASAYGNRVKSLLGLYPPDEKDKLLINNLPPNSRRDEFYSRTREYLKALSSHGPIMLVIEDIHDVDLSTLDILDFLIPIIFEAQVSILLIARSEMPGPHRSLIEKAKRICQDRFLQINLRKLSKEQSVQLILELLETPRIPNEMLDFVEPFIGHPLSLEEIVRYLVESGIIWKSDDNWNIADNIEEIIREAPTSFRELLLKRLTLLDHESLHILQTCSLLGESFDQIVLSRIFSENNLAQRLSELSDKGWLQKSSDGNILTYTFKHTLTQETIYSTMVRSKMQLLHQRAGEAIESLYPETIEENVEVLAYHFEKGGIPDKSLHYQIQAAEKCASNHALHESRGYFQKAKSILTKKNQAKSRAMIRVIMGLVDISLKLGEPTRALQLTRNLLDSSQTLSNAVHASFLRRLGDAYHLRGDLQTAVDKYHHALDLINSVLDSQLSEGRDLILSSYEESLDIRIGIAKILFDSGENTKSQKYAQSVLAELSGKQNHERVAAVYNTLAGIAFREVDFHRAQELTKKSLASYQANNNRSRISAAYSNLGVLASIQQEFISGHEYFSTALEIQTSLGDNNGVAISTNNLGQLEMNLGHLADAKKYLGISNETARRSELFRSLAQGLANIGFILFLDGKYAVANRNFDEAKTISNSYPNENLLSEINWKQAECFLATNNIIDAESAAKNAIEIAEKIGNYDLEAQGLRSLGRIYRHKGKILKALTLLEKAWTLIQGDRDTNKVTRLACEYVLCLSAADQISEATDIVQRYLVNKLILEPEFIREEILFHFPFEYKFPS
jgi:predicted ATPase/class 3 adenylate cyclase/Tfp pilus assembly protein PilF